MKQNEGSTLLSDNKFIALINTLTKNVKIIMNRLTQHERLPAFFKKPAGQIALVTLVVFILISLLVVITEKIKYPSANSRVTSNKLKTIDNQTNQVASLYHDINQLTQVIASNNHLTQNEISQLSQQVQAIQLRAQQLSDQDDVKQLSQSLSTSNQMLSDKIAELQSNVNDVKQVLQPHNFIDPKNLPLKVISVDIWDGTPYATVSIDDQEDLMGVNESRAGWTVDSIDFASHQIVFRNDKNQFIKIQLEN